MKLPGYEVEFIPFERRLNQRRSPVAQTSRGSYPGADRRDSPGRRQEDREALQAHLHRFPG